MICTFGGIMWLTIITEENRDILHTVLNDKSASSKDLVIFCYEDAATKDPQILVDIDLFSSKCSKT